MRRRKKSRNYVLFCVLFAAFLTVLYATSAQPLAYKLATILPDNSRFGLWYGSGIKAAEKNNTDQNNNGNNNGNNNNNNNSTNGDSNKPIDGNSDSYHGKEWDVGFTDAKKISSSGHARELAPVTFDSFNAYFHVTLSSPGDQITYVFTVKNKGTLDAKLNDISVVVLNNESDVLTYDLSGLEVGDVLLSGKSQDIKLKIKYNDTAVHNELITQKIMIVTNYVQK